MGKGKACSEVDCETEATRRERCEKHYKAWLRQQSKCNASGCNSTLFPADRTTRADYCRLHERLALTKRSKAAQEKSLQRFRQGIEPDWVFGCWLWAELPDEGYGKFHAGGPWLAHRFAYVWFIGGHGRRQTLDHMCNRPLCVRPDHMQPVSDTINTSRRDRRAFAPAATIWRHGKVGPDTTSMDEWAAANELPFGNPPILTWLLQTDQQSADF